MTRAHFIKAAAKDYPREGISKGESYWKWSFRFGGVHRSKKQPRPSQLTQSEFMSSLYSIEENIEDLSPDSIDEFMASLQSIQGDIEQLRDETEEKLSNMPDSLQQGDTGQLMEERIEALDGWAGEIGDLIDRIESRHEDNEDSKLDVTQWRDALGEISHGL